MPIPQIQVAARLKAPLRVQVTFDLLGIEDRKVVWTLPIDEPSGDRDYRRHLYRVANLPAEPFGKLVCLCLHLSDGFNYVKCQGLTPVPQFF
jgi:hypothetical protein